MEIKPSYEDKDCGFRVGSMTNALACAIEPLGVGDSLTIDKMSDFFGAGLSMPKLRAMLNRIATRKRIKLATKSKGKSLIVCRAK